MSTTTPNLNLIQPAPAESGILTTYKTNNTTIDNAYGQYINDYEQSLENVAPIEGSTASKNYTVGQYLVKDGGLYKVTSAIASGENIVVGTNVTATSLNDAVVELNTAVATLQDSVSVTLPASHFNGGDEIVVFKRAGIVTAMLSSLKNMPAATYTDLFTLPQGWRPPTLLRHDVRNSDGHCVRFSVETDGRVTAYLYGSTALSLVNVMALLTWVTT